MPSIRVGLLPVWRHRIAGLPSLLQVSRVTHLAGACTCTKQHIPLQGRVCVFTSTGNRSVCFSSLASQYLPDFCRKFTQTVGAAAPHGAQANARDPAWRWTAAVLAATTQQVGPAYVRLDAPTLSPLGGNLLSTPGLSEYLENASLQGQVADGKSARGHDLDTSQLNVLDILSKNVKRKQQRSTRRSAHNLPETKLTNAEMNSVGPVTRLFAPRPTTTSLRGPGPNNSSSCDAGPSACTWPGAQPSRGWRCLERSTESRNIPTLQAAVDVPWRGFVRDEPGFFKDSVPLGVFVILTSDLLQQHRLLDKLAGLALAMSYDLLTRPSETLKISSCPHAGRAPISVSHQSGQLDDTVMAFLRGLQLEFVRVLLLRLKAACRTDLPLLSPLRFNDGELVSN